MIIGKNNTKDLQRQKVFNAIEKQHYLNKNDVFSLFCNNSELKCYYSTLR